MLSVTLPEISKAFRKKLKEIIEINTLDTVIVPINQDITPNLQKTILIQSVNPGMVYEGELGEKDALSYRTGNYIITLSIPNDGDTNLIEEIASIFEDSFRHEIIFTERNCKIDCEEPWTTNVGRTEDKRYVLYTTIPWTVYFNTINTYDEDTING